MGVAVHVPHVGDPFFLQVRMNSLADADETVLVAARDPEQFQLPLRRLGIGRQLLGGLVLGAEEKPPTQAKVSR